MWSVRSSRFEFSYISRDASKECVLGLKLESFVATNHLSRGCFASAAPSTFSLSPRQ